MSAKNTYNFYVSTEGFPVLTIKVIFFFFFSKNQQISLILDSEPNEKTAGFKTMRFYFYFWCLYTIFFRVEGVEKNFRAKFLWIRNIIQRLYC